MEHRRSEGRASRRGNGPSGDVSTAPELERAKQNRQGARIMLFPKEGHFAEPFFHSLCWFDFGQLTFPTAIRSGAVRPTGTEVGGDRRGWAGHTAILCLSVRHGGTAIVGGPYDNSYTGAARVSTNGVWAQLTAARLKISPKLIRSRDTAPQPRALRR